MSWLHGQILDCDEGHHATTPAAEWRDATARALVREIVDFLQPGDTIDCARHSWLQVEVSHGLAVAECLRCRALLVETVA
jgi:hypothetical protein